MKDSVIEKINSAPNRPGVYIFSSSREILYVGKAKNLRNRLKSYLGEIEDPRIVKAINKAEKVEFIITKSEEEALLLEANLIKIHKPRYNIRLKDDKKYPYIKITNEPYPAIALTRNLKEKNVTIFGPFVNAQAVRKTIRAIRKIFPIRTCKYKLPSKQKITPCIDYHIGKCLAPCRKDAVSVEEYQNMVQSVVKFLKGKTEDIERNLEQKIQEAVKNLEFEKAAIYRDELLAIRRLTKEQAVHNLEGETKDIVAIYKIGNIGNACILKIRNGILIDKESYFLDLPTAESEKEILSQFLSQYYSTSSNPPPKVITEVEPLEISLLSSALGIQFEVATKDEDKRLTEIAYENAKKDTEEELTKLRGVRDLHAGLVELAELLKLEKIPERVEACDISQLFGSERVGVFICFLKKGFSKSNYRRYRIKTEATSDPYMIYEVVKRRLDDTPLPDVILIDGGLPQLNFAKKAKEEMGVNVPLIAFAKRFDDLYLETGEHLMVPKRTHLFTLLKIIRDEAHRFAIEYHRKLREKKIKEPEPAIKGLSKNIYRKLIEHFGSIDNAIKAGYDALIRIPGIGQRTAEKILELGKKGNLK